MTHTITQATRDEALRLLEEGRPGCWSEIEKLLGWTRKRGMTVQEMAERLGLKKNRVRYLANRRWTLREAKRRKVARRAAEAIPLFPRVSRTAACTLFVPEHWVITTDTREIACLAHEYLEYIVRQGPSKVPTSEGAIYENGKLRPMTKFERLLQAKKEYEERVAKAKDHDRVERMVTALFEVDAPDDAAHIQVTRLKLDASISAIELYQLSKNLPDKVWYGNRPKNGIQVDGLTGVLYYHSEHTEDTYTKASVFTDVYLVDGSCGWIISCDCECGDGWKTFKRYKPLFLHILRHFQRRVVGIDGS